MVSARPTNWQNKKIIHISETNSLKRDRCKNIPYSVNYSPESRERAIKRKKDKIAMIFRRAMRKCLMKVIIPMKTKTLKLKLMLSKLIVLSNKFKEKLECFWISSWKIKRMFRKGLDEGLESSRISRRCRQLTWRIQWKQLNLKKSSAECSKFAHKFKIIALAV